MGFKNQVYIKDFLKENIFIRDIISLEKDFFLEALLINSIIIASIKTLLEAFTKYNSL